MRRDRVLRGWQPSEPAAALPALGWVPVVALLVALVPRAALLWGAAFPLNDGGLTAVMVEELVQNGFVPPAETAYNSAGIPWVYPPLSFFLAGAAVATGASDVESVLLWLPLVLNLATVLAFCWAAEALVRTRAGLAAAAVAFAIMPFAYNWQIMGAGLPRAAGFLFATLTVGAASRLFERRRRSDALLTTLFASAAILCHPEMLSMCGMLMGCLWLVRGRSWQAIRVGSGMAVGVVILTSPWWLSLLARHGLAPLTAASATVEWSINDLAPLPLLSFTGDGYATPLAILATIGTAWELTHRRLVVPVWLFAAFAVPRLGFRAATIPAAILVGVALGELIVPALSKSLEGDRSWLRRSTGLLLASVLLGHSLVMVTFGEIAHRKANPFVSRGEREAARWVAENTPRDASFLVLTSAPWWAEDPISEWFPALTDRTSVVTPQGCEWLSGEEFLRRGRAYDALKDCRTRGLPCLAAWVERWQIPFDFVFVSKVPRGPQEPSRLAADLAASTRFAAVYDGPGAVVFARR